MVAGRAGGKTYQLIDWFLQGEPRENAPGWSRVIICASSVRAWDLMRQVAKHPRFPHGLLPTQFRHAILNVRGAGHELRGLAQGVELGFDDAEVILQTMLNTISPVSFMTVGGALFPPLKLAAGLEDLVERYEG